MLFTKTHAVHFKNITWSSSSWCLPLSLCRSLCQKRELFLSSIQVKVNGQYC